MDNLHPQSGAHANEGHEESDLNIRGIVIFALILVICGVGAFVGSYFFFIELEKSEERGWFAKLMWGQESQYYKPLTPMEQKVENERSAPPHAKAPETTEGLRPAPDWYGRGKAEERIHRTFITGPRLQYDDAHDVDIFVRSEEAWLQDTGKDAEGNTHIPIDHAMDRLVQTGLPAVTGTFSTAKPQMPAPLPTVWQEVPAGGPQPRKPNGGASR
ncbi:MAG TPA: hypothetical protein VN176_05225 [Verrucomicrobiae bacterium]|jgi:hypothetical protein|nr:hypothetical protein [Verrucomicrobiae bacterium]